MADVLQEPIFWQGLGIILTLQLSASGLVMWGVRSMLTVNDRHTQETVASLRQSYVAEVDRLEGKLSQLDEMNRLIADIRVTLPEKYVPRAQFEREIGSLAAKLQRMQGEISNLARNLSENYMMRQDQLEVFGSFQIKLERSIEMVLEEIRKMGVEDGPASRGD